MAESTVMSYNEWDPLEEVIVGVVDGAAIPAWHVTLGATMPARHTRLFRESAGQPFPQDLVGQAIDELERVAATLEQEGVTVRRPDKTDFARPFSTPEWSEPGGLYALMPRDCLLIVGDLVVEVPMAWRSRYFEHAAFRSLLKDYFKRGARWMAAPRPELRDALYDYEYDSRTPSQEMHYAITEFEPTFDAADILRFGKDLVIQLSHVTNEFGVEWLRRALGDDFTVHVVDFDDDKPMHLDATIMPLAPGRLLVNPERAHALPSLFKGWEILKAPEPPLSADEHPFLMSSAWLNMNLLALDHERVLVEAQDVPMMRALEDWGFHPILCPFRHVYSFGGSFHCTVLDVRRAGTLERYLDVPASL